MSIWFYSYTWENPWGSGRNFEHAITDRHPLLEVARWNDEFDGNNNSKLIAYQQLTEEDLADSELRTYVEYHLESNGGELFGSPDE